MAPDRPGPSCAEVAGLIDAYVDDDLGTASASRVRAHLDACGPCRHAWEVAVELKQELNTLPAMRCPERVMENVMRQVAPRRLSPRRRIGFVMPLGLAAAAAIAVSVYLARPAIVNAPPANGVETAEITPQELADAEAQLKWTLAYIGRVNQDSAAAVQGHVAGMEMLEPARDALSVLLNPRGESTAAPQES